MTANLRLGDHCLKIGSGATPRGGKETYLANGPYSLIRSQNVLNERFSIGGLAFISQDQADLLSNVEVQPDDVLLNITGDSVARVCQVDPLVLPARVNQHVAIIRPKPEVIDPRFLRYFLVSPEMQAHMLGLAASGATRNALTKGMIEKFEIPAVPLSEQRTIAATLGALDDKIELNRKMNTTLEAMARALFRDWFVDFGPTRAKMEARAPYLSPDLWALFPERLDDEGKPEGWESGAVSELVSFNPKESLRKGTEAPYLDMAALPTQGANHVEPTQRAFSSGSKFRDGDTLLARITPCLENGKTCLVHGLGQETVAWGSTEFIVMRPMPPLPPAFGYLLARDEDFRNAAIRSMTGTSGRQRATVDAIANRPFTVPPREIMLAFGAFVNALFERITSNERESRTLAHTRDLLLPRLMSGELRMADFNTAERETAA